MELGLRARLASQTAITALVGQRIYPLLAPQNEPLPHVVYRVVSSRPTHSHDGPSGLIEYRVQIDCWAASMPDGMVLRNAVRTALDGFAGTAAGVEFGGCFFSNEIDLPEPSKTGKGNATFRRAMDFQIFASEE